MAADPHPLVLVRFINRHAECLSSAAGPALKRPILKSDRVIPRTRKHRLATRAYACWNWCRSQAFCLRFGLQWPPLPNLLRPRVNAVHHVVIVVAPNTSMQGWRDQSRPQRGSLIAAIIAFTSATRGRFASSLRSMPVPSADMRAFGFRQLTGV